MTGSERTAVKGNVRIDKERCKGCSLCIEFCPKDSVSMTEDLNLKGYFVVAFSATSDNGAQCNGCGICAVMCPEVAIEVEKS